MSQEEKNKNTKLSHAKVIENEYYEEIRVEDIVNNPLQPRLNININELEELARSIETHGLIQPISVIRRDDQYILEAGQRRWLAHKKLGLPRIKAIVHEESIASEKENDKSYFEKAIAENIQRKNLDPLELALSLKDALDKKLYKNKRELSQIIGKSESYVGKVMQVLTLDEKIIKDLRKNRSTKDVEALYELQKITDPKEQVDLYFSFIKKKINRKELREINRSKKNRSADQMPYKITGRAKKVSIEFDTTKLIDKEIIKIKKEIAAVLDKYLSREPLK